MEFVEGSRGIYRPIRVLFDTTIYERALQLCWHVKSYKTNIALVIELLRLQCESSIPSKVSVEDMTDLLVEQSKATVRVQLWEFELEDFDEEDAKPLLMLVWEVINSMKMRDIEFEARRLLQSPEDIPPCFQHPKLVNLAQEYGRSLTQQLQSAPSSKLLGPRDVVMEVLPKVLQGFWLPPPSTFLNMPSQQLSEMAVGVTKFVLDRVSTALSTVHHRVNFSRSIRDSMVLSIQEMVRQMYPQDVLRRGLNCFAAEVLNTIVDAAVKEVLVLFQPQTDTPVPANSSTKNDCTQHPQAGDLNEEPGLEEDGEPIQDPESSVLSSPPTPLTPNAEPAANIFLDETVSSASVLCLEADSAVVPALPSSVPPTDEPLAINVSQDGLTISQIEPAEQFTPETDTEDSSSAPSLKAPVATAHPPPPTPPAEPTVTTSALNSEDLSEKMTREPDSVLATVPTPTVTPADEPPTSTVSQDGLIISQIEPAEQPAPKADFATSALNSEDLSEQITREPDSVVATAPTPTVTPADEPPTIAVVQDGLTISQIEPAEQPAPKANFATSALNSEDLSEQITREPDSVVATAPTPTVTPADEPPTIAVVQDGLTISQIEPAEQPAPKADFATSALNSEDLSEQITREPDSVVATAPTPTVTPADEPPTIAVVQDGLTISQIEPAEQPAPKANFATSALNSEDLSEKMTREPDSVLATAPTPTVTPADEPPTIAVVQDGLTISQIEPAEQPAPKANFATSALNSEDLSEQITREPDSVVANAPTPIVTPADEPPTIAVVQDGLTISQIEPAEQPAPKANFATSALNSEDLSEQITREPDSAVTAALQALPITHDAAQDDLTISQVKVEKKSGVQRFFSWFRKTLCCCCLPEDAD
ncbi:cell surface glycoprotein 1-like [Perca fluviatilis]|uniref:cell surface glycoprotein 1-like n=1 Tax=Perca fluviatilis TaxID=8168 RepID=UPI001965B739|nr:cell surface glycoprotein 1-like [Perca fluviatilis]